MSISLRSLVPATRNGRLMWASFLLAGVIAGFLLVPGGKAISLGSTNHVPNVVFAGEILAIEGDADAIVARARALGRKRLLNRVTLELPKDLITQKSLERTWEELGAELSSPRLVSMAHQLTDPSSAMRRASPATVTIPAPIEFDPAKALGTLLMVKDELDLPPVDARYSLANHSITKEVPGLRMDVYATLAKLEAAWQNHESKIVIVAESVPAKRTAKALGEVSVDDVLGYFETKYARDFAHEARTFNLRLAASKLDGYVLLPGEVFDFNEVVGPRSEAYGYKIAPVIAQGELVDGIGGGTCQVAGTLHGAAFFSGLEVVERKPHTRPSYYIKMGLDATVVYPTITLRLRNPFPFPVVLHETVQEGIARAEILGPKRTRDVTFVRKIEGIVPFPEREVKDPTIPKDERVLKQRGIPGFRIVRYRIVRDGPFAVRERMLDAYPATAQIWSVGTGDKDPDFKANDDGHPEYVADEVLTISQGPTIHSNSGPVRGGGTSESRIAGRYGSYGWTVREGLSKSLGRTGTPTEDKPGTD